MRTTRSLAPVRDGLAVVAALAAALVLAAPVHADGGAGPAREETGVGAASHDRDHASPPPGLGEVVLSTRDGAFDADVANQGWWARGETNRDDNDNYIVGWSADGDVQFRNFFTFDVSDVEQRVLAARLELSTRTGRHDSLEGDPVETYALFDVSTPAWTLNANDGRNPDVFRDLGTGESYGVFDVDTSTPPGVLSFDLDQRAIRDLNRQRGGYFSVGGRLLSIDVTTGADQHLFGWTNRAQTGYLVLQLAAGPH